MWRFYKGDEKTMMKFVCPICGADLGEENEITDTEYPNCYICSTCFNVIRIVHVGQGINNYDGSVWIKFPYDVELTEIDSRWPGQ